MGRKTVFIPYKPKTVLNKGKRADHWFWSRYSAYPYIGCQHGCQFCYCREQKYSPYDDPHDFAHTIKIKENAPELLRKGLSRAPRDVVFTGDYQPAERKFMISRKMLEVCHDLGFPIFVLERSVLVLRDLDLLQSIHEKARAVVAFSLITTPGSPGYARVRQMENLAAPPEKRFAAMEALAKAGLITGSVMMPILPGLCDDDATLQNMVRWTADHGGQFVITGGLTLSDQQRGFFFEVLNERFPDLVDRYAKLYPAGQSYGPVGWSHQKIALRVGELCEKHGIAYRVPRPIIPGEKRALNKRVVETLARKLYDLELANAPSYRQWAYRKTAWAIEDLEQDLGLIYRTMGVKGLESIPNVGPGLAKEIEGLILQNIPQIPACS